MNPRLLGFELYFDDLEGSTKFYREVLGLELVEEHPGHHAKFGGDGGFLCLERKGVESYPSLDKAVVFLEVDDLAGKIAALGPAILQTGLDKSSHPSWAVLRDPEGHNVVLIQRK